MGKKTRKQLKRELSAYRVFDRCDDESIARDAQEQRFAAQYAGDPWRPLTEIFDQLAVDSVISRDLREDLQDALAYVWHHGRADAVNSLCLTIPSEGSDRPEFERRLLAS